MPFDGLRKSGFCVLKYTIREYDDVFFSNQYGAYCGAAEYFPCRML